MINELEDRIRLLKLSLQEVFKNIDMELKNLKCK